MGKRREGREAAVQFLVFCDLNRGAGTNSAAEFWDLRPATKPIRDFALNLVEGVLQHRAETDERIIRYADNYDLDRLAVVDRNILRLAIYEMLHRNDIPPVVSINEAIEIAKRFGTEDSSRFVNGILDRVKLDLTRPLRVAGSSDDQTPYKSAPGGDGAHLASVAHPTTLSDAEEVETHE